ncbi:MAG TPA: 2-oxoglutarate dehydrogenase complex dihydrolipoyllysine-residue succinyltransferase [Polyangiaceae bacterium]|nr:2-oxoglutarate dehydrogenase complex dihydrolipoyllysine-residue succinyltransferase [Polyangiaceae bacterium]
MTIELKVPPVGESITEVQIGEWLKAEGDSVQRDEIVVKIETDKVTVDLPAPVSGRLSAIKVKQGQTAAVGDVIGSIEEGAAGEKPAAAAPAPAPAAKASAPAAKAAAPASTPPPRPAADAHADAPRSVRDTIPPQGFARVMPSARRALKERGLRAEDVEATGPGGRVLKEDVMRAPPPGAAERRAPSGSDSDRHEEVVAMSPFRKRIAERLVQSQQTAALLTTFNEVDMSAVIALRKEYQDSFSEKYGIKLGFMSFFVKAAVDALKLVPAVNGEIRGSDIVYKNYFDIGVAVGGGKGLAVPVIRGADRLSFAEVEQTIADFGKRAKDNKLELSELLGGTFTISNGGVYGSLMSTPIVNPPQSGILGLHAMQDRPVAVNGQVVIRPMMYIALTYDHRLIDGREAVTFLKRIKHCVEQPARMLLEV